MVGVVNARGVESFAASLCRSKPIKLLPIAPKEPSIDVVSWPFCVAREGDLVLLVPEKRPLIVDTVPEDCDLIVVVWDCIDKGEDLDVSGTSTMLGVPRPLLNSGSIPRLGVGDEYIPCARIVNMTSISPLGSLPVGEWAGRPRPARIDLVERVSTEAHRLMSMICTYL